MKCVFDFVDVECYTPDEIGACYRCPFPDGDCDVVPKIYVSRTEPLYRAGEDT